MLAERSFKKGKPNLDKIERIYKNQHSKVYVFRDDSRFIEYNDGRIGWGTKREIKARRTP